MCGIIGIASNKKVSTNIVNALKKLEYRGYDSAGLATISNGGINVKKCSGINWKIEFKVFDGWIITLVVVGSTSALITAQGIYAPSKELDDCNNFYNITN